MYLALLNGLFLLRYGVGRRLATNRSAYWFVLVGLFLFSAFRFRVGCDWIGYYNNFAIGAYINYDEVLNYREPFWWIIQIAFNDLGLPYPLINIFTSFLFFVGIHALARRQPDPLGFIVLLFPILIINMPMSGIRQAAAIGFLCFASIAFIERRPFRFVAWIALGSTIHSSILAFLLFTPLVTGHYTKKRVLLAVAMAAPGGAVLAQSDAAQIVLDRYLDTGIDAFGALFRVGLLSLTATFYFTVLRRKWAAAFPSDFAWVSSNAWVMLALLPLVGISSVIADRLAYYLIPAQTIILARIPYMSLKNVKLLAALPYMMLTIVFAVWSFFSSHFKACYVPYQSWIFGNDNFGAYGF